MISIMTEHVRYIPWTYSSFGDRSFSIAGPRVWNVLTASLRQDTSYGQFIGDC